MPVLGKVLNLNYSFLNLGYCMQLVSTTVCFALGPGTLSASRLNQDPWANYLFL